MSVATGTASHHEWAEWAKARGRRAERETAAALSEQTRAADSLGGGQH